MAKFLNSIGAGVQTDPSASGVYGVQVVGENAIGGGGGGSAPTLLPRPGYSGNSLDVSGQSANPFGMFVGDGGTKLYSIDYGGDVYQYTLPTPWSLASASYANKTFGTQGTQNSGVHFSSDGTVMFNSDRYTVVYQYDLSTAWDVSTATYNSENFSTSAQVSDLQDVRFSSDGTVMFAIDSAVVYQYTLSTPWDVTSATYASKSFNPTETTDHRAGAFSTDGTVLFLGQNSSQIIYQYTLSTAWDISTASYSGYSYDASSQVVSGFGSLFISTDGKRFYAGDTTNDAVYEYNI